MARHSTTDDKRQDVTTAQTQDDSDTGVGRDVRPGVCGMTHGVRLVCGFVGTGRVVTGGPGDKRSRCERRRGRDCCVEFKAVRRRLMFFGQR